LLEWLTASTEAYELTHRDLPLEIRLDAPEHVGIDRLLGAVAANARAAATGWLADVVPGDEILTAIAPAPVGEDGYEREIASTEGVVRATPIASFDLAYEGRRLDAVAIRGADFAADGRLTFTAGDRTAALAAVDAGEAR
jgi:hypothetical protein